MIICNLTGKNEINTKKVNIKMNDAQEEGIIVVNDSKLVNKAGNPEDNAFMYGLMGSEEEVYRKGKLSAVRRSDIKFIVIKETPENPLILTISDSIGLYPGVECDLRLFIDDGLIYAMLISGICMVGGVELARCTTATTYGKNPVMYSADTLVSLLSKMYKDKDSGYDYSGDIISNLVIEVSSKTTYNSRRATQDIFFINKEGLVESRKIYEQEKLRKEIEEEAHRKEMQEATKRIREENARREKEKLEGKNKPKQERKRKEVFEETTVGAADFLRMVSEIANNQ
mgnify:FL=1